MSDKYDNLPEWAKKMFYGSITNLRGVISGEYKPPNKFWGGATFTLPQTQKFLDYILEDQETIRSMREAIIRAVNMPRVITDDEEMVVISLQYLDELQQVLKEVKGE